MVPYPFLRISRKDLPKAMCCLLRKRSLLDLVDKDTEQRCLPLSCLVSAAEPSLPSGDRPQLTVPMLSALPHSISQPWEAFASGWLVVSRDHRVHWILRVKNNGIVETNTSDQGAMSQPAWHSGFQHSGTQQIFWTSITSSACRGSRGTPPTPHLQGWHIHSHSRWEYWPPKASSSVLLWKLFSAEGNYLAQDFASSLVAAHIQWLLTATIQGSSPHASIRSNQGLSQSWGCRLCCHYQPAGHLHVPSPTFSLPDRCHSGEHALGSLLHTSAGSVSKKSGQRQNHFRCQRYSSEQNRILMELIS